MKHTRNMRELLFQKKPVRVIGITGGIASGKTTATAALRNAGYTVIDADEVSRELFGFDTDGEKKIMLAFPEASDGGKLNRALLRKIISADETARNKLNELTHPAIIERIKKLIAENPPPVILSAPLLYESGLSALCDVTVCVYCPRGERIKRLRTRDNISEEDAAKIIDAQIPDYMRCTLADYIVPNVKEGFTEEVVELINELRDKSL